MRFSRAAMVCFHALAPDTLKFTQARFNLLKNLFEFCFLNGVFSLFGIVKLAQRRVFIN